MGLIGWLALRGMLAQRLSLVLLTTAIAIGVGFQIPNTANLAGSSATLVEETLELGPGDIRVEPRGRPRFAAPKPGELDVGTRIEQLVPGSRTQSVIVLAGGAYGATKRFVAAPVFGVDFATGPVRIATGTTPLPGDLGVVLGSALARQLEASVGDSIELRVVLGNPGEDITQDDGGAYTVTVRGIAGNSAAYQSIFIERAFLSEELHEPRAVTAVLVHTLDHDTAAATARQIEAALPGTRAIDWETDDPFLPTMLRANRVIERVSYGMVVAAISIPLLALFYIRVLRRRREIAILRAIGFSRRAVFAIYVGQSIAIGLVGSAVGALIGYAAIAFFDRHPIFQWETMVVRPLSTPSTFALPILAALLTATLAGAVAAWRAARTDPARMLQRLD
jgi:ABC-type lipoprotein release transport system permease subunit